MKPLCIDLFSGLGGWTKGFLAEGFEVVGFDIERHVYGEKRYPAQLVLQDVLTLHGSQFKDAACIVASPPCQRYSWMAMPFSRGKREAAWQRWERDSPFGDFHLNDLFDACFRIQREAIAATARDCPACGGKGFMVWYVSDTRDCERCDGKGYVTRHIPMVVENVKGAQPWVGRANASFGSFYLWGDVRSVGGRIVAAHRVRFGEDSTRAYRGTRKVGVGVDYERNQRPHLTNPAERDGRKVPGMNFHEYEKTGQPGRSFQSAAVESAGVKQAGMSGPIWCSARKAASAQIAEIPLELSSWVARCFKPDEFRSKTA